MKTHVLARLAAEDRAILEDLKGSTGCSESEVIGRGLQPALREKARRRGALDLTGRSAGRLRNGPRDLAANKGHLDDFGQ